jgi:SAM-dependent methyltransferase
MGNKLRRPLPGLRDNLHLYATFVVCIVVLALEMVHPRLEWIETAILITLLLVAAGTAEYRIADKELRDRLDRMAEQIGREPGVKWYSQRTEATAEMLDDLAAFAYVAFLGISHRLLSRYLRQVLERHETLPWVVIRIYFASPRLGELYEGRDFKTNLRKARQEIAAFLTQPANARHLPHLSRVQFFQHNVIATHTGSIYSDAANVPAVIYVVHSSVQVPGELNDGLTIRLEASGRNTKLHQIRMGYYTDLYAGLERSSRDLGAFSLTAWDLSAHQWANYSRQSDVLRRSMAKLIDVGEIKDDDSVLDLGAGSGEQSDILLGRHPGTPSLVLLDASPQMARLARERFRGNSRIRVALCTVPAHDGGDIDLDDDEKFSLIVMHQALWELAEACGNIGNLATWCQRRLRPGGRTVVAAHNGALAVEPPKGYERWKDPFRAELMKLLRNNAEWRPNLRPVKSKLLIADVESAFKERGFVIERQEVVVEEFGYEDRRQMWRVPAVLDSVVDVRKVELNVVAAAVESAFAPLMTQRTMPRTMVYWRFVLKAP